MQNVAPSLALASILVLAGLVLILVASQLFWVRRLGQWLIKNESWRRRFVAVGLFFLVLLFAYNLLGERESGGTHLTLRAALLQAPFRWWIFGSVLGFVLVLFFSVCDRLGKGALWAWRKVFAPPAPDPPLLASPGRRRFLEQSAVAFSAAPFLAGAYGLKASQTGAASMRSSTARPPPGSD